jgi:hypothetical protein
MSVTSETDIGNLALDLLSAGTVGNIVTPSTPTESLLERWYDQCRQKVLREHPWNFATKRAVLAASSVDPAFGGGKAFPIPNDFMRLMSVHDDGGNFIAPDRYTIEHVGSQRCIIMQAEDTGTLRIKYVFDIKDVSRFDPLFVHLLAHEIALAIAFKVTESNGAVERVEAIRKGMASLSKAIDGQESPPRLVRRSNSLKARRNLSETRTDRIIY